MELSLFMSRKIKRWHFLKRTIIFLSLFSLVLFVLALLNLGLPDISNKSSNSYSSYRKILNEASLGALGDIVVAMLPDDLAFTIFLPSEAAFKSSLNLTSNDTLVKSRLNDTYAILSRVLGFSAVPRHVTSSMLPVREEMLLDSVSGFRLCIWKTIDEDLMANNVRSEHIDLKKGNIIIHIMSGVIMDMEFERSFNQDYED